MSLLGPYPFQRTRYSHLRSRKRFARIFFTSNERSERMESMGTPVFRERGVRAKEIEENWCAEGVQPGMICEEKVRLLRVPDRHTAARRP